MRLLIVLLPCSVLLLEVNTERKILQDRFQNPFDTLHYDKAIAYDYDGQDSYPIITQSGELVKFDGRHGMIFKQKEVDKQQVSFLHKVIGDTATYGAMAATCFDPHLGIVYYKNDKIVAHISICLACNYLRASMEIPASNYKKYFIGNDTTMEFTAKGFSRSGSMKLSNFCNSLNFGHCSVDPDSFLFNLK